MIGKQQESQQRCDESGTEFRITRARSRSGQPKESARPRCHGKGDARMIAMICATSINSAVGGAACQSAWPTLCPFKREWPRLPWSKSPSQVKYRTMSGCSGELFAKNRRDALV